MAVEDIGFVAAVECPQCGWRSYATEQETETPIQDVATDIAVHEACCGVKLGRQHFDIKLVDFTEEEN